jgi:Domain of unknown function (DUF397)
MNDIAIKWRKSSYSTGDGTADECVEIAYQTTAFSFRDSKSPDTGHIHIPASAFVTFLSSIKA